MSVRCFLAVIISISFNICPSIALSDFFPIDPHLKRATFRVQISIPAKGTLNTTQGHVYLATNFSIQQKGLVVYSIRCIIVLMHYLLTLSSLSLTVKFSLPLLVVKTSITIPCNIALYYKS